MSIALSGKAGQIGELATGRDFYASPRLSPDGTQLAFLAWDLPDMPWDSATLYLARVGDDGRLGRPKKIAGGDGSAVFQPEWGPDGQLYFVWDETGWGQLYRWQDGKHRARPRRARRGAGAAAMGIRLAQLCAAPRRHGRHGRRCRAACRCSRCGS